MTDELRPRSRRDRRHPGNPRQSVVARHGKLKKSNSFTAVAKVLAAALSVALVSGLSVVGIAAANIASGVKPTVALQGHIEAELPEIGAIEGGANLLLVGNDSREGQGDGFGDAESETGVLNDVTMLMHIAQDHTSATVISFPRDTFVSVPECVDPVDPDSGMLSAMSSQKINTTLGHGGLGCVVATVEDLTGLSVPFAASIQFMGVAAMSEAVGGVPVCIAEPIQDEHTDLDIPAGVQELRGLEALQFLRTRHGVGDGSDLGRISNQQVFLSALVRTLKSAETLSDPLKLYGIAEAAVTNMELSDTLASVDRMVSIAAALKDIPLENVTFVQWPTGATEGGLTTSWESADELLGYINSDVPPPLGEADAPFLAVPEKPAADDSAATPEVPDADAVDPDADADVPVEDGDAPKSTTLPSNVYGQTAGEVTCSAGRPLEDQ